MKVIKLIIIVKLLIVFPSQAVNSQVVDSCLTDVINYSFQIIISDNSDSISGEATIELKALAPYLSFALDFENQNLNGKGMTVYKVENDGQILKFWQKSNKLIIENKQKVEKGNINIYKILYGGIPADGLIISKNRFGKRTFFADNWPERARYWLPCNDFPADKASVDFSIIAPSHYQVVANGRLAGKNILLNQITKWNWREGTPISTKVMVFGAADFAVETDSTYCGFPVQTWVYIDNKNEGFLDYSPAKSIVEIFQSIIGKYPYEKLANVQSTTIFGGMENASCIFYAEKSVTGKGNDEALLAHEIAHQWFGNSVTECNWSHLWLSEGFATFFANVYYEKQYGIDALHNRLIRERDKVINWPGTLIIPIIPNNSSNPKAQLNPVTYEKAAWVLHMLRSKIGDTLFFKGIRNFFSQFTNKTACTEDFIKIMETVSGEDLNEFFNQWLYKPGYPVLQLKWHYNSEQKLLQISIDQMQQEIFKMPLEILVIESNQLLKIRLNAKSNSFSFKLDKAPVKIIIDPGLKVFGKITQSEY
jgi:aminopeptidase N